MWLRRPAPGVAVPGVAGLGGAEACPFVIVIDPCLPSCLSADERPGVATTQRRDDAPGPVPGQQKNPRLPGEGPVGPGGSSP
jgi:hypothetical protein